jgi:hypothetical protein
MKETPVDRYRRLRYEVDELEKELQSQNGNNSGTPDRKEDKEEGEDQVPAGLMLQVSSLKGQLASIDDHDSRGEAMSTSWNIETRRLLDQLSLQSMSKGRDTTVEDNGTLPPKGASSSGESARLAEVDRRLADLETLVGVRDAFADEVSLKKKVVQIVSTGAHYFP